MAHPHRPAFVLLLTLALTQSILSAQQPAAAPAWDVTQPRGRTRQIDFTTTEGTWMSVDLSPDGRWIVFDLLGHIYRMPASGGEAIALTQNSGVAVNYHPRISPDGRFIAFVSDRRGQNNLWVMNADGSNPRPVFTDNGVRVFEPAWSADGEYIIVRRQQVSPPGTPPTGGGIWMYHRNGGEGVQLVPQTQPGASWPAPSRDGRWLYFQVATSNPPYAGQRDFLGGGMQIRRLDIRTGEISAVTAGEQSQQVQSSSGGAAAPQVSPDGRWLAFARRVPDGTISYKGHRFGPRTALWLRDLESGSERLLMDPIEMDVVEGIKVARVLPGYVWARDGRSILISQGGGIRRVDVQTGRVTPIPFSARVLRTISEMAYAPGRIADDSVRVRFARWHTASPDGRTLAFQALGRIWLMDLPRGR
ncbi:MAG: TolB family protein, partial [Gemmatimonadaceae bacterium]